MSIGVEIHKKLGDFSLDLAFESRSRRIGILGPSGCGKSMTLKCIAGIEKADQGFIHLEDRILFDSFRKINPKPQKRNVGYLFQNYALFPSMTVRENIGVGIKAKGREKAEIVTYYIEKFHLSGLEDRYPRELSGGQQQRVALARIMAYEPDVILLDEPFSALDLYLKDRLQRELSDMLEDYEGYVIMVSHSRDEIYRFCEDLLVMDQGKAVCYGDIREIFLNPVYKEAARLTGCKNIVPVRRVDAHRLEVPAWNLTLRLQQEIGKGITHLGIRAHDFKPVWLSPGEERKENSLKVNDYRIDFLPFERKYYIRSIDHVEDDISWFVQKDLWKKIDEQGMPDYLEIIEDRLLLLK